MSETDNERAERVAREVAEAESEGASWRDLSNEYVVGYMARRDPKFQNVALGEMQRRLISEMARFSQTSTSQAAQIIGLTQSLRRLTWVMIFLAVTQLAVGVLAPLLAR